MAKASVARGGRWLFALPAAAAIVLAATGQAAGGTAESAKADPARADSRPVAVVYAGPAGCPGCSAAVAALISRSPRHFRVFYIGPHERRKLAAADLRGVALYAQPGGNGSVGRAMKVMGQRATSAIRDYVAAGGRYLGFCMGAYLAGSDPGMGLLLPGNTGEYDRTRGASVKRARQAVIPVRWGNSVSYQYAQDPPYMIASHVPGERVLARFTNHKIDALVRPYHRGVVGVVGTHPEANRSWYTPAMWRKARHKLAYAQGLQLIAAVMSMPRS